jgi:hypothetical protein
MRRIGLVAERRADTRSVDQHDPATQDRCGIEDVDPRDPETIAGVRLFGNKTEELFLDLPRLGCRLLLRHPSIEKTDPDRGSARPVNEGGDRGKRHDPGRQQPLAEKSI